MKKRILLIGSFLSTFMFSTFAHANIFEKLDRSYDEILKIGEPISLIVGIACIVRGILFFFGDNIKKAFTFIGVGLLAVIIFFSAEDLLQWAINIGS